jgi:chromosome segregation ATPase
MDSTPIAKNKGILPMVEMSIWVPVLLLQACLITGGGLGFFLWRERKSRRRLQHELAEVYKTSQEKTGDVDLPATGDADLPVAASAEEDYPQEAPDAEVTDQEAEPDAVLQMPEMMHGMITQLEEKNGLLQQHVKSLHELMTLEAKDQQVLHSLSELLRESEEELQALQKVNLNLKGNLQEKKWHLRVKDDALDAVVQGYARLEMANRTLRLTNAGLKLENEANKKTLVDYEKRISRYTDIQAENFGLKQQVNRSSHAATAEQEIRFLKQELWEVKNKLAQRETELRSVQEQYEDVSAEYQRLFTCLRT